MVWSDYWGALSPRQRIGLIAGAVLIVAVAIASAVWLLRDPYVSLAAGLNTEQVNEVTRELDRAKLEYRVGDNGDAIWVPQSQLGKTRAATAGGPFDVPPSVGLELFKETDFSTTDFAQRINYQRALQGELTRTIQTIVGVRSARVHVILPDGGLFKRASARASAAVSVAMQPGNPLTRGQVRGIQRLVTASVPEIKIDDVVVLDESGASLTRATAEAEGDLSSAQLDLKRQADQYLESKLTRLLQELVPQGTASLSVDTTLDDRQTRVTTEEPIATAAVKQSGHATGVLVKERQSQRGRVAGMLQTDAYTPDTDSTDWEYEYKVGNRIEQVLSAPGSIKRVSVAVALQGAPAELSGAAVEQLVAHAVGIDRSRGDSISVLLLPGSQSRAESDPASVSRPGKGVTAPPSPSPATGERAASTYVIAAALFIALAAALAAILLQTWRRRRAETASSAADVDVDAVVAKVRQWLNEGGAGNVRP